jgi:hypothetical protein
MTRNRELIEKYISSYNSFNIDEMIEFFSDDCKFENVSGAKVTFKANGRDELKELSQNSKAYFQEYTPIFIFSGVLVI